jgi:hypothetical protein
MLLPELTIAVASLTRPVAFCFSCGGTLHCLTCDGTRVTRFVHPVSDAPRVRDHCQQQLLALLLGVPSVVHLTHSQPPQPCQPMFRYRPLPQVHSTLVQQLRPFAHVVGRLPHECFPRLLQQPLSWIEGESGFADITASQRFGLRAFYGPSDVPIVAPANHVRETRSAASIVWNCGGIGAPRAEA